MRKKRKSFRLLYVPPVCPVCGSAWQGGHALPYSAMIQRRRIFYKCGCSLSYKKIDDGVYNILAKGCSFDNKPMQESKESS